MSKDIFALAPETANQHIRGMRRRMLMVLLALVSWLQLPVLAAESGDEVLGVWHTTDDKGQVFTHEYAMRQNDVYLVCLDKE